MSDSRERCHSRDLIGRGERCDRQPDHPRSPERQDRRERLRSRSVRARRRRSSRSRSWSDYRRRRETSRRRERGDERQAREDRARQEREERERDRDLRKQERAQKEPSATVLVHGIPEQGVLEDQVESAAWSLAVQGGSSMPNSARFAYDGNTQQFRGFAIIDFPHKDAAKAFKEHGNGLLEVEGHKLTLTYDHSAEPSCSPERGDRSLRGSPGDEPSSKLIVRGLSSSTKDESIAATFQAFATIKDVRHFPRRGFAFVEFHSIEEASLALQKFEAVCRGTLDGVRVTIHFAKGDRDSRLSTPETGFQAKQALASAAVNAQIEQMQRQQVQTENTEMALSGVNGDMWASYMESFSQTEAVQSTNSFSFDSASGFHKDAKAGLYYDPQTTFFFTTDFKKHFMYDQETQMLCLIDEKGQKVNGGEQRPLSSASHPRSGQHSKHTSVRRSRSRSRGMPVRRGASRSRSRRKFHRSCSKDRKRPKQRAETGESEKGDFKPIHFAGGDPLARLAPAGPAPTPKSEPKKKKRAGQEQVLGLASVPAAAIARPGRVTVLSSTSRPGPVQIRSSPSPLASVPMASRGAAFGRPDVFASSVAPRPAQAQQSFATAPGESICEVCMRKFSSEEMLRKHENFSDLHKQNLAKLNGDV